MEKAPSKLLNDEVIRKYIYTTVSVAALLPEYIAPFFTLVCFLAFKRHFTLTKQKVSMGTVGKVFLLFMCYSFISCLWSQTALFSAAISLLWMGMLLGSFIISNMTVKKIQLDTLVTAFALSGGSVGAIGILQYIILLSKTRVPNPLWSILDGIIHELLPFGVFETAWYWRTSRAASTFDNPLICATFLILVLPLAVYGFTCGNKKDRNICGVCSLLILAGIISTTSRGAAVAVVLSLLILVFMNSRKMLSVLLALAGSLAAFVVVIVKRSSLLEMDLEKSSDSRINMWKACWKYILKKPLFGYGAGSQGTAQNLLESGINKPHAHSLYVEMTSELGFVGIVFLLVVFGFIIYDIVKIIKSHTSYSKLGIAYLSIIAGFLAASFTEFTMQTPKELQYFMLILGMIEATKRLAKKEAAENPDSAFNSTKEKKQRKKIKKKSKGEAQKEKLPQKV